MSKPKVVLLSDVPNWAWERKCQQLCLHLQDEFEICYINAVTEGVGDILKFYPDYDVYVTFSSRDIPKIMSVPREKRVTGFTVIYPDMQCKIEEAKKHVDHVHANNNLILNAIKSHFKNTYYVPNGVNENFFCPLIHSQDRKLVVGHVGKPTPWKGFDEIIQPAIKNLPEMQLLTNHRRYKQAVPKEEMRNLYRKMDVFLVASNHSEGTPNPALEAAACGVPIIGTKVGNMPELIKHGVDGFLIDRNPVAFRDHIQKFIKNRNLSVEMGKVMRQTIVNGWTWKKQADNYRLMFRKVLNG
tara:strand:+ start:4243 stop:5139 length:897 start_codon:yes stop_codon:yes gene_type:complete